MTREEAIKLLRKLRDTIDRNNKYGEAEEMAIQALEQEPFEDAISRDAVEEIITDIRDCISVEGYWAILERVEKLQPVKPQESCDVPDTNVGDIISKQTVLDTISELNAVSFYEAQEDSRETYYEIRQAIKDLSPVKQEPQTGHWIEQIDHEENCRTLICSNCDRPALHDGDSIWKHKFCPHCGAKMVEPQERSE